MKRQVNDEWANRILTGLAEYSHGDLKMVQKVAEEMTRETYRNGYENTVMAELEANELRDFLMGMLGGGDFPYSKTLADSYSELSSRHLIPRIWVKDGKWKFDFSPTEKSMPRDASGKFLYPSTTTATTSWYPRGTSGGE